MPELELRFLGSPVVRRDGRDLTFRTRKALALLAFLALEPGAHTRERLTGLLWPDSEPDAARNSLRNALSNLRDAVGDAHLSVSRAAVAFDARGASVDALELEAAALARGDAAADALVARLDAAVSAVRGDLLEGFTLPDGGEFDDWLLARREAARRHAATVLERLSDAFERRGDAGAAVRAAERWAALDRLDEAAHRRVMSLHVAAGNRGAALEVFERLRSALRDEVSVEPSPETLALAERARVDAAPGAPVARRSRVPSLPALLLEGRLVGRVSEYVRLVEAYHAACLGRAGAAVLSGEPGIGKTRLAAEFLQWAAAQGARVLRGRAFEAGGGLAYQPVADALRRALDAEPDPRAVLGAAGLAELSRLVPSLRDRLPDLPAPGAEDAAARARVFDAVARFGQALSARAPLVVFVDDLQWADAASLDLIAYAARRWAEDELPVLVVLTVRSEALGGTGSLAAWLTALSRDLATVRLELGPLGAADTARLAEVLAGGDAGDAGFARLAAWLQEETGGQPLYVAETLKALAERGVLVARAGGGWTVDVARLDAERERSGPVAPGVQAVIASRLSRLSAGAVRVAGAAAALGQGFDFDALRAVAGLEEGETVAALEELLRARLLVDSGEAAGPGAYAFSHDRVREVAYELAGESRRVFHRRALAFLEGAGAAAAVLSNHAWAAGAWPAAFRYGVRAGEDANRVEARRAAIVHFERARRVMRERLGGFDVRADGSAAEVWSLYAGLNYAFVNLNEWDRRRAAALEGIEVASSWPEPRLVCGARLLQAGIAIYETFDLEGAERLVLEARGIAEANGLPEMWLQAESTLASLEGRRSGLRAEIERVERTLERVEALGPEGRASWLVRMALLRHQAGEYEVALELWREALDLAPRSNRLDCGWYTENVGLAALNAGRVDLAERSLRESYELKRDVEENPSYVGVGAAFLAFALVERGEFAEALELADRALGLTRLDPRASPRFTAESWLALGQARASVGRFDAAIEAFRAGLALVRGAAEPVWPAWFAACFWSHLCAALASSGAWAEAAGAALEAVAGREATGDWRGFHSPRLPVWVEVEALARGGEVGAARSLVSRLAAAVGETRRLRLGLLRALAALEGAEGRRAAAVARLVEARDLARALGLPGELWSVEADLASALEAVGDEVGAAAARGRALEVAGGLVDRVADAAVRADFRTFVGSRLKPRSAA